MQIEITGYRAEGKTHLAMVIADSLIRSGYRVEYVGHSTGYNRKFNNNLAAATSHVKVSSNGKSVSIIDKCTTEYRDRRVRSVARRLEDRRKS